MNLQDQVAVVTGGAKGLGRELARQLAAKGARVMIGDRDWVALAQTASEFGVVGFTGDVTDEKQVEALAQEAMAKWGRIDLWINNAGVWLPPQPLEETDLAKARQLFDINVFGAVHGARAALRQMRIQERGTIVNIVSTTAFDGMRGASGAIYVASKYALRGFTNTLRDDLRDSSIKIIGVYPGGIKTELFTEAKPEKLDQFMAAGDVAEKIISNLELPEPLGQLILKRPGQTISPELAD